MSIEQEEPTVDEQHIRESIDTEEFEKARDELIELLEECDPTASEQEHGASEIAELGQLVAQRYGNVVADGRRELRERRREARKASEEDSTESWLSSIVSRLRGSDDGAKVVERNGRDVVIGECPIGAPELVRLREMNSGHQDVYVRDVDGEHPPSEQSDSPLVPKFHSKRDCPNADFSRGYYKRTGLANASESVPCPNCCITDTSIRTVEDALEAAPPLSSKQVHHKDIADKLGWPSEERMREFDELEAHLTGEYDGESAEDIAKSLERSQQEVLADLKQLSEFGDIASEVHASDGRTYWYSLSARRRAKERGRM